MNNLKSKVLEFVTPIKPYISGMVTLALLEIAVPKVATTIVKLREPLEKVISRG